MRFRTILISLMLLAAGTANGQRKEHDLAGLYQDKKLSVFNRTVTLLRDNDKKGLTLNEKGDNGSVWLNDVTFSEGTIEVDLRGKDSFQKSFLGIAFHGVNDSTYDVVYFRPFNFQATDPVRKIHAVQYISEPEFPWSKLRDTRNGVFEKAIASAPNPNDWFHARIEVSGKNVSVYVNDEKTPSLTVEKLNDRKNGGVALWVGDGSGGDFANLKIIGKEVKR